MRTQEAGAAHPEVAHHSGDGRTLAPFGRRKAGVVAVERHGAYIVVACQDGHGHRPQPGQFYMLASADRWGGGEGERPFLPRAFSVMRASLAEGGARLEFLVEDVGPGTKRLCELGVGEALWLLGPLGNGFRHAEDGRTPLLVGGGVGIAPLAILQDRLEAEGAVPRVLLGFRDAEHAHGARLLRSPEVATDDGSVGHHGLVTELLEQALREGGPAEVYACGPPPMLEAVRVICGREGIPGQLALESGMACGFGACFGCVVATTSGYLRLCIDGPVLQATALQTALAPGGGHQG